MGADQDVHAPFGKTLHGGFLLGRRAKPRDVLQRDRVVGQPLGERPVVLLGEDRRRHQHQHLLALVGGLERGPQGHLGLAVADISADQPVHRPRRLHVRLDQLDRLALVRRLGEREALLELPLPVGVDPERVPRAALSLGVQAQQLARQLLHRAPCSGLHRLPAGAAELAQRRVLATGTHVARDLRELVGGHEHAVIALVFEVQVVARDVRHGARLKAREARYAVVLVHHDVACAQLGERAQRSPAHPAAVGGASRAAGPLGAAAAQQAVLGEHRELQGRRDEALAQRPRRKPQRGLEHLVADVHPLAQPRGFQAPKVVGRALALAAPGKRHHRPVAGAHELLELRLGLPQRARRGVRRLGAQLDLLVAGQRRQPDPRPLAERVRGCARGSRTGGGRPRPRTRRRRRSSGRSAPARAPPRRPPRARPRPPIRSSSAPKRSTGRSSAMSGRLDGSSPSPAPKEPLAAAISASSRCSAASSAAGAISTSSTSPSDRCVNVENQRSDSISTSNMSTRTARSSVAGNTSRRPPRIANCPRSSTWSTRS